MSDSPDISNPYDLVPYPGFPFPYTHPAKLATIARVFGMQPAEIATARVLELGCCDGGNIIPMAEAAPKGQYLGIDYSQRQIEQGQQTVDALGLKNIELRVVDLAEADACLGEFDYIICHGVYSWVRNEVQEKILEICRGSLAPAGVAYVSYNTYPGWHMRGMIRHMMRHHVAQFDDVGERVPQARALLRFLADNAPAGDTAFGLLLRHELEIVRTRSDSYLFHEHLEDVNEPIYFHEFMERAKKAGLRYLGEADVTNMWIGNFSEAVRDALSQVAGDLERMEQYMDFLRNRAFRCTLLCHRNVKLERGLGYDSIKGLYVSAEVSPAKVEGKGNLQSEYVFVGAEKQTIEANDPLLAAALRKLGAIWPDSLLFDELVEQSLSELAEVDRNAATFEQHAAELAGGILRCFVGGVAELSVEPAAGAGQPGERPQARALARHQAESGPLVTSLRHQHLGLNEFDRCLVALLDGTRDRPELLDELKEMARQRKFEIRQDDHAVTEPEHLETVLKAVLEERLQSLADRALLIED